MRTILSSITVIILITTSGGLQADPLATDYTVERLGFTDAEHTQNDGYRYSIVRDISRNGKLAGNAQRYSGSEFLGWSSWIYSNGTIERIGLVGTEYTRSTGFRFSVIDELNEAGQVTGSSSRFNSFGTDWGKSAWLYNGTNTVNIGLTDAEHTDDTGYQSSNAYSLNEAGHVAGTATRYAGSTSGSGSNSGQSAWLYNGTNTTRIGLTDSLHTSDSYGRQYSEIKTSLNEAGQVAGISHIKGSNTNQSAWLYNGTSTTMIGLTDAEHSNHNGYWNNTVRHLNEAGQAVGQATRYNGSINQGRSAWLYNGTTTVNIGLTDTDHTRADGYRDSFVSHLNQAGGAAGTSRRYVGTGNPLNDKSAWYYNDSNTVSIGLYDAEHTNDTGSSFNDVIFLNEAGHVAGTSNRHNGTSTPLGRSAWIYNGSTTINVSLTDAEHTRDNGMRNSSIQHLNEAGQAAGVATRYNGSASSLGNSAWLYDGTSTSSIGLVGSEHTRDDGFSNNEVSALNDAGQVAGFANRYDNAGTQQGQSSWLYDLILDQTFGLDLHIRSDGYAYSEIAYLGDDGLALGYYELFDTNDSYLGNRAFAFTLDDGAIDLGDILSDSLETFGWDVLADAYGINDLGQIVGTGLLSDMPSGSMPFLLTPVAAVPVPASVWLFASGLVGMVGVCRRRNMAQPLT